MRRSGPTGHEVSTSRLAGLSDSTRPDGRQAVVVATTGEDGVSLAAYRHNGLPCLAMVAPAPGSVVCATQEKPPGEFFVTGSSAPVDEGDVRRSLVWGWAPVGTVRVDVTSADSSYSVEARDSGARFQHRANFIAEQDLAAAPITFEAYDRDGQLLATQRLGGRT
jgi:hypothetical protein